jgi:hypothetical protein
MLLKAIDQEAKRIGVTPQAMIKLRRNQCAAENEVACLRVPRQTRSGDIST